jgi:hypothetical protein
LPVNSLLPSFQYGHVASPDTSTPFAAVSAASAPMSHYPSHIVRRDSSGWGLPAALRILPSFGNERDLTFDFTLGAISCLPLHITTDKIKLSVLRVRARILLQASTAYTQRSNSASFMLNICATRVTARVLILVCAVYYLGPEGHSLALDRLSTGFSASMLRESYFLRFHFYPITLDN